MSGSQNNSRAHQALQQASLALRMRQFSRAEQLATEVLKSNRTDKNAVLILAHALIAQNRVGKAIEPLERAVRRSSDPEIETLLGAAPVRFGALSGWDRATAAHRSAASTIFARVSGTRRSACQSWTT